MRRHLPAFEVTGEAVNCHHNYVERETHYGEQVWLTRKGAIRAGAGELGIIPGQHGRAQLHRARQGLGRELPLVRARRRARRMSRNAAQKKFHVEDLEEQTAAASICRKDKGVIDEIPGAYKTSTR